jgi:hypothetical protein
MDGKEGEVVVKSALYRMQVGRSAAGVNGGACRQSLLASLG